MAVEYTIKNKNKLIKCVDFKNLLDQYSYIKKGIDTDIFNTVSEVSKEDDFFGKNSMSKTVEGMSFGFQDETNYFLDKIEDVKNKDGLSDGVFMDNIGFAYDMGAYVSGEPECCINMGLPQPAPYVCIMVDLFFSAMYSAKQILNRGIAVTNLVNTLLLNGCVVDLFVFEYNLQSDFDVMYTTKIDTKTLPISSIAFVCTPEYFRKIGFITCDVIRNKQSDIGRGSSTMTQFMLDKIKKDKIFYIGGSNGFWSSCGYDDLDKMNDTLIENFNKYCVENKIVLKLNNEHK